MAAPQPEFKEWKGEDGLLNLYFVEVEVNLRRRQRTDGCPILRRLDPGDALRRHRCHQELYRTCLTSTQHTAPRSSDTTLFLSTSLPKPPLNRKRVRIPFN